MSDAIPAHAAERLKGLRSSVHPTGVFTSDFSVNEFLLVRKAGFEPIGLCVGSCVYHVAHQGVLKSLSNLGQNTEITPFTQAMYDARELAMERMQNEAMAAEAEGVVGVQLHEGSHNWQPHVLEFFAVGTAVKPIEDKSLIPEAVSPQVVIPVND